MPCEAGPAQPRSWESIKGPARLQPGSWGRLNACGYLFFAFGRPPRRSCGWPGWQPGGKQGGPLVERRRRRRTGQQAQQTQQGQRRQQRVLKFPRGAPLRTGREGRRRRGAAGRMRGTARRGRGRHGLGQGAPAMLAGGRAGGKGRARGPRAPPAPPARGPPGRRRRRPGSVRGGRRESLGEPPPALPCLAMLCHAGPTLSFQACAMHAVGCK